MKKIIAFIALCMTLFSLTTTATADLGNYNSYSSNNSSGSYSGGNYSGGGYSSRYSNGYIGGVYASSDSFSGVDIAVTIAVVIAILAFAYLKNKNKALYNSTNNSYIPNIKNNTNEIVSAITKYDHEFSNDKFIAWAKETFITLQTAWSEREFDKVRNFEKEELFNQHKKQLDEYISKGWINDLSRININQAYLFKYVRDNDYEYLSVYLDTRMGDYIKDEKTGAIIKGDPNQDYYLKYIYTFMRKTGVLTDPAKSNKSVTNCPNCGAPTTVTSSGQCEYCGSVITTGEFDWVLSDITGVNNNTTVDNGGVEIRTN